MKRLYATIAFAIGIAFATPVVIAQNPQPQPGPEVKKLDYFAGDWKLEGEMKPGPFGPGGKYTGSEHSQWMEGGFFLVSHSTQTTPMGSITAFAVYGYDPNDKVYTFDEFNTVGEAVHAKGTVEGDTWTWTSETKMGSKTMRGRFTEKILSPTSYTFKFEASVDGAAWMTIVEGKLTKGK